MKLLTHVPRVPRRRAERVASVRPLLIEAAVLLRVGKEPTTTDPEFAQWAEKQKFRHPQTGNDVQFKSLPAEEQAKIRARWQQAKEQEGAKQRGQGETQRLDQWQGLAQEEAKAFEKWLGTQKPGTAEAWEAPGNDPARNEIWKRFKKERNRPQTVYEQMEAQRRWEENKTPEQREKERADAEKKEQKGAERRKKLMSMPPDQRPDKWTQVDNGNSMWGRGEIKGDAKVTDSKIVGTVDGNATVKRSEIGNGARVGGDAQVTSSSVDSHSVVEDNAKVTRSEISGRARVRGDSEISNAKIRGGTWDGVKLEGRGGVYHDSYDPKTLGVLSGVRGNPSPGDGPLRAMRRYLADGGKTKGWLGGDFDRKKLQRKIQRHVYDYYDRKNPWLGRGASFLDEFSDEDFAHLMDVAQREADELKSEKRKKKAMLYQLTKTALERPELREKLMPLVRLGKDARVASGEIDLRQAVIRTAYESSDSDLRKVLVRCVVAAERAPEGAAPQERALRPEERRELVRKAYHSSDPEERRSLLAKLKEADERHDELIDALSVEHDAWEHDLGVTATEHKQLVRVAYETKDVGRRREILALLKEAKYSPGFMKYVEKQKWKHPETGNMVQFVSLPSSEQKKINEQWKAGKKDWAQKFKPDGLGDDTVLTPEKFDALQEGDRLWISWSPAYPATVTGFNKTKTGKPVLEYEIQNPKTGAMETRYMHRSSAGNPKHDIHVLPEGAMPKDPKAQAKEPEKAKEPAKPEKAKEPAKPKISEEAQETLSTLTTQYGASTWLNHPGMPGDDPEWSDEDAPFAEGAEISIEEGGYAPVKFQVLSGKLVKGPKGSAMLVRPLEGEKLTSPTLIPIGGKYEPKKMDQLKAPERPEEPGWEEEAKAEALKIKKLEKQPEAPSEPEKAEAPEPEKPKKTEAPKPAGKHKDRKEIRGVPKPDDAKVKMSSDAKKSFVPEGLSDEAKAATEKGLKGLTYGTLKQLASNVQAAVDDPEGPYAQALAGSGYTPGELSKMHATIKSMLKGAEGRKYNQTVLDVANKYDLESEDADELYDFKDDKPGRGKKLTPQELMQKFLAKAAPETKERMQGMAIDDFMAMYNAIMADEDEEELA